MPLLNYTTSIAAGKTASEMQAMLAKAGATQINSTYDGGALIGLSFAIDTPHGMRTFALPVDVKAVEKVLGRQRIERRYNTPEQAERTAWRILKDWLEAQLAIIETQMVTLDQVMLPYMTDELGHTVYDLYASRQLALGTGE